jgi:hypothetical protein
MPGCSHHVLTCSLQVWIQALFSCSCIAKKYLKKFIFSFVDYRKIIR